MKYYQLFLTVALGLAARLTASAQPYDFQNTKLSDDKRVDLFVKHLTLDEKMMWMSSILGTPRLGVPIYGCYEGLHGLALGGPSRHNGVKTVDGKEVPNDLPTTIFPQAYGMGATWDPQLIQRIGEMDGDEVVQLYVSYPESKVEHPKHQLKAFKRVTIPAGQTCDVVLEVAKSDLTYWDETNHTFVPEKGNICFEIGASSADLRSSCSCM